MRTARILIALAPAVLLVAACGGGSTATGGSTSAAASQPAATTAAATSAAASGGGAPSGVAIANFAFSPAEASVAAGSTVTWTNSDDAPHTVKWSDGADESDRLEMGDSYQRTFETAGTFDYVCGIHPNMTGSVTVTE